MVKLAPIALLRLLLCLVVCFSLERSRADELPVGDSPPPDQLEFFEARIRPVLVEHCYSCHNSLDTAEGGLRLDFRGGLLEHPAEPPETGRLIVPGDPAASRLLAILRHEVVGLEMPQGGGQLDDRVIDDFSTWIAMGAPDPRDEPPTAQQLAQETSWEAKLQRRKEWWSFQPIQRPAIPEETLPGWSDHPIDRLLAKAWQEQNLTPAEDAEASVLARRLHFVLTGLPPEVEWIDGWTDRLNGAASWTERSVVIEALVDELLESPSFGERWARHWMDWTRYAESHGSEGDPVLDDAWVYRDYLIRAWNDDIPYDQLLREHFAGDLLPQPRINEAAGINESVIGPAHLRMVFHGFSPTDSLEERVRFTDDQINTTTKAFLGLTVSCARCHDHKFDAISQADYYALYGVFNSTRPGRKVITPPGAHQETRDEMQSLKREIQESLATKWLADLETLPERIRSFPRPQKTEEQAKSVLSPWYRISDEAEREEDIATTWQRLRREAGVADYRPETAIQRWRLSQADDYQQWTTFGSGLPEQPSRAGFFAVKPTGDRALVGIYPAGVYSHGLTDKDPARLGSPEFFLDGEYDLWLRVIGDGGSMARFAVQNYPRRGNLFPVQDLTPSWQWRRFDLSYWNGDHVHVELTTPKDAPLLTKDQPKAWLGVRDVVVLPKGTPRPPEPGPRLEALLATTQDDPTTPDQVLEIYQECLRKAIVAWQENRLTDEQADLLEQCREEGLLSDRLDQSAQLKTLVQRYRQLEEKLPVPTRVPGVDESGGTDQPLYVRGNHKTPDKAIPRRFLEAIDPAPYPSEGSGRLQLAESLLRDDNPLPRRVIVNRLWLHLYGRGIVETPDNFGKLGVLPSHPELLDYLAARFVEEGWSLKRAIRQMVTSRAWQLSSVPPDGAREIDPDNRFLSHAHIRRLEAEAIRDSLLRIAGELQEQRYGPPVGGNTPRRSIYLRVRRNSLDHFLRAFDFPEPFTATGRRDDTNVPAQSLMLMNDPLMLRTAAGLVRQVEDLAAEQRIERMFQITFSRLPEPAERKSLGRFLEQAEADHQQLRREAESAAAEIARLQAALDELLLPVRNRLNAAQAARSSAEDAPQPVADWDFSEGLRDRKSGIELQPRDGGKVTGGTLRVDGKGYVISEPLPFDLREKTLEAWVELDTLNQRSGGVMTLQTLDGREFDAIVFGEQNPRQWMAGSNGFTRTRSFGGPEESEADQRVVHLAITYHADGRIVGYRNGQPYGQGYRHGALRPYPAGSATVGFGVRHLPAGGNRMLSGKLHAARLYDQTLDAEQIAASFQTRPQPVTDDDFLAELSSDERKRVGEDRRRIAQLQAEITAFGLTDTPAEHIPWLELARAMLTFQELIYLR